ncbi:hypothetical protein C5167_026963 [Papaver somniferum]|uniref:uncharacterized protein LOC113346011 n=1 Tax=Papaver somniferum TaxID=3469 RepID=UPI000E7001AB|nr:uncharacterized protein LOC113346011 [Papaver somniferum]RZC94266.1 hypothetical protein C5167_026963 [Papaver somniferum]
MARIIMKDASSLTPVLLAYTRKTPLRNYSSSSSIFSNPQLKNNISHSLIYKQDRPLNLKLFSSLSENNKGPSSSDQIIRAQVKSEDLLHKTPSDFPFKIEDKPGKQTVTLTREYRGDDIKVIVHMPAGRSSTVEGGDEYKDSVSDPQSSIRLVVSRTNLLGTTLEYGVIAYPDDFSIDSFCIKYENAPDEENIYYRGPAYAKLDKNLQKEFHRRLKILGIIPSTTRLLHGYMANRDMCSSDSANSPPTDQSTPESIETTIINDEGIPVHYVVEVYRQRGHPLVSADDIRNSRKNPKDFIWIPYPHTRSEKLLWIEVPSEGFFASQSELQEDVENDLDVGCEEDLLFLDGEDNNPYRCLPPKDAWDPPVFSEEMDKILYPDLKHMEDVPGYGKALEYSRVALKAHDDEMDKIVYPNGSPLVVEMSDLELEHYQVWHM